MRLKAFKLSGVNIGEVKFFMQVNVGKVYHTMCQKKAAVAYEKWSFNSREVPAIVLWLGFFVFFWRMWSLIIMICASTWRCDRSRLHVFASSTIIQKSLSGGEPFLWFPTVLSQKELFNKL